MADRPEIAHHAELDARLSRAARGIQLLGMASWPAVQAPFLEAWHAGKPRLPQVDYPPHDFSDARRELDAIAAQADPQHPLGAYLVESARSRSAAAALLEVLGTDAVTAHSVALFGRPDQPLPGNGPSTREAARHGLAVRPAG